MNALMAMMSVLMMVMVSAVPMAFSVHARQPVDTWFIMIDELHIQFMQTGRLRSLVRAFVDEVLQDGAMYALRTTGPSKTSVEMTADVGPLHSVVKTLTGNALRPDDVAAIRASGREPNEISWRLHSMLEALETTYKDVLRRDGRPGSLLYISSGYFDSAEYRDRLHATLRPLLGQDTRLFVVDPREPDGPIAEILERGRVTLTP
jgi:hypothetical protein